MIAFGNNNPKSQHWSPALAGDVKGWRSAESKSNNYYGKISSIEHKIFFSLWRDGSSKKFTLRK